LHRRLPGDDFGKYMSLNRFKCLRCGPPATDADPFLPIRAFAEAVAKKAMESIVPGAVITIDESMGQYTGNNMPGQMVVPRKPIPVGREYHTACDVESGICIAMEMVEGQALDRQKEFVTALGVTTATTLRLTQPWWGTGRIFIGDSWFASVKTAMEMKKRGCDFVGQVKTAHSGFPVKLLHDSRGGAKGDLASAVCEKDGIKLLAINQNDHNQQQIIATCSTTLPGKPRNARFSQSMPQVPRCQAVALYYSAFNAVDMFNSARHGSHCLNLSIVSHDWAKVDFFILLDLLLLFISTV